MTLSEFDHLGGVAAFVTAARAGSFTAAAEKLGVTKSAVGKSIARLENRLGMQLFNRTTRKIALTVDGESYFETCSNALDEILGVEVALTTSRHNLTGRLHIDMPVSFGRRIMMPVLLEIARPYPRLQLTLTFSDHVVDPITEGIDLTIRFGELENCDGLIARKLSSQRLVTCASPTYVADKGMPQTIDDLKDHSCIVGHRRGRPLSWWMQVDDKRHRVQPSPSYEIGDGDAILDAAKAGLGICQFPISLVRPFLESGELVPVLEKFSQCCVEVHALWPQTSHLSPKIRHVVDRLVEVAGTGRLE
ncbi:LysR family transcriptional regulator [Agrobacterium tumefaciens]|uniref:HTH-type transcriptional regulator TtuA n=1 Tax=Agrobacterium tumefaciens TaxID=358 RepID=A0AA44JAQ6_AGRTU|nr:LysR family transcriptional regulator [Agrobacterium tumefaciens]NTC17572.1 LysR family transcriptional regulator [Agrobacterium tumefaciens]NTC31089.1 LysR family transcriptional regulator [Agrobacterium tumefaciens]